MKSMTSVVRWAVVLCLGLSLGAGTSTDLGSKVVAFCNGHLHEQVGNGQCAVLASSALKDAGARGRGKDSPGKSDYTWGDLAVLMEAPDEKGDAPKVSGGSLTDIRPGDIVQLRDVKLTHHNAHGTSYQVMDHHTAVVTGTEDGGRTVHVLQQNVSGKLIVMPGTFKVSDLSSGWMRFYHPVLKAEASGSKGKSKE